MAALLDILRRKQQQVTQPQVQPNVQQDIMQTIQAKSGKAALSSGGPAISDIQQRAGQLQGQAALQQQAQAGELQQQQLQTQQQAQEQQAQQAAQEITLKIKANQDQFNNQVNAILNDVARNERKLDQHEKQARLEQAGFLLRIQNDDYINNLQRTGQLRRLNNEANFQEELRKAALEDDYQLYKDNIEFQKLMDADDRTFKTEINQMKLDQAWDIFQTQAKGEQMRNIFTGIGAIGSGLAESKMFDDEPNPDTTTTKPTG